MIPKKYDFIREVGTGKSGISSLVVCGGKKFIYKEMHSETVSYYHFSKPKIDLEIEAYHILEKQNIHIPKLVEFDRDRGYLIKEFVDGLSVSETLCKGDDIDPYIKEALDWEKSLKSGNINIDYFPSNFVIGKDTLFYIDYEVNPYSDEWSFSNWGIYYWLNGDGFRKFAATKDSRFINIGNTGVPIKNEAIEAKRKKYMA